jgi:hypothetical protein
MHDVVDIGASPVEYQAMETRFGSRAIIRRA